MANYKLNTIHGRVQQTLTGVPNHLRLSNIRFKNLSVLIGFQKFYFHPLLFQTS